MRPAGHASHAITEAHDLAALMSPHILRVAGDDRQHRQKNIGLSQSVKPKPHSVAAIMALAASQHTAWSSESPKHHNT